MHMLEHKPCLYVCLKLFVFRISFKFAFFLTLLLFFFNDSMISLESRSCNAIILANV